MKPVKTTDAAKPEDQSTEKIARSAIEEARMVTPGIQALFGFQLVAAFDNRFKDLGPIDQGLHYFALVLVALSVAVIVTPAAYHRIAEQGSVSNYFVRLASWLIAIAMAPLMLAICLDVYIIGHLIVGSAWISIAAACILFIVFAALWYVFPVRAGKKGEAKAMSNPQNIEAFAAGGEVRMIVETPRGSPVKLKYDPKLEIFTVSKSLPLGLAYPFDWGFIPGTKGEDGDPLDALAVHDCATYPGVLLPCRLLGVVDLKQKSENGWEANPRFILMPLWHDRLGELEKATALPERLKKEIEQFFLSTDFFTHKHPKIEAWKGPNSAEKLIRGNLAG